MVQGQSTRKQSGIPRERYEQRSEAIRDYLNAHDLGALLAYSPPHDHMWAQTGHVAWLSGWGNSDRNIESAVIVPASGDPVLLAAGMQFHLDLAGEVSPIEDRRLVRPVDPNAVAGVAGKDDSGGSSLNDFAVETDDILSENGLGGQAIGVVGLDTMPVPFFQGLQLRWGDRLQRFDDIVAQLRAIKCPEEVELMRRAAQLHDLGFETMLRVARPGMRGNEIVAEMERAARQAGADHAKWWMASGPATTWDDAHLEIKPHERVIGDGDLMAACSYIVYEGYWCHGQRTGTMCKPNTWLSDTCRVMFDAQDAALEMLRPGVPFRDLAIMIRKKVESYEIELIGGRYGHGIGSDYTEQPVPLNDSNENLIEAGNTVVVHSVFELSTGTMMVPLGDVCHVTDSGAEMLMKFPRKLFVAGQ